MTKLFFLFAFIFALSFSINAQSDTLVNSMESNCVVTVINDQDSAVASIYTVTVDSNTVNLTSAQDSSYTVTTTDTITNQEFYGGYEVVVDLNSTVDGLTVTLLYRANVLTAVGINRPNQTSTFYLYNPNMPEVASAYTDE